MAPRRSSKVVKVQNVVNYENLTVKEVLCPICRSILIEPVTLPCNHGFCSSCFQGTIENANLVCPLCRIRIASWLRSSRRENKLINVDYWNAIQKNFPNQIKNKLEGIEENLDYETPFICLAQPGELKQEYEKQIKQESDSIRKEREAEIKASEELIRKIREEEEAQRKLDQEKLKLDEEIARKLAEELNSPRTPKNKNNGKHGTLDKYFKTNVKNFEKKEFTCKILYQGTKPTNQIEQIEVKKSFNNQVQKIKVTAGSSSDSSDSIDEECRFFKPIEHNKTNVSVYKTSPIKIPVIRPMRTKFELKPPNGKNCLRFESDKNISSAFTQFIPITTSQTKISKLNNTKTHDSKSKKEVKKNFSPAKKQNNNVNNNGQFKNAMFKRKEVCEESLTRKKLKLELEEFKEYDRVNDDPSPFCGFEIRMDEQEKLDFELAKRLQDQEADKLSYCTRALVRRKSKQTTLDKLIFRKKK